MAQGIKKKLKKKKRRADGTIVEDDMDENSDDLN